MKNVSSRPNAVMPNTTSRTCILCGCDVPLTFHHLIPRKIYRRNHFVRHYTREQFAAGIHNAHDEMTLAKGVNTLEKLQRDKQTRRHVRWVARQKT
ncbi:MAG TPA: hypothetical protein VK971_06210 [Thiohalobacter sp.]|nr:hypothetical protein [Thiohalobacter sp.]